MQEVQADLLSANVDFHADVVRNIPGIRESQNLFDDLSPDPADWGIAIAAEDAERLPSIAALITRPFDYGSVVSYTFDSAHWQATRSQRDLRSDDKAILLAIHEQALRLKFEGHPNLARRLAACRYPIIGDGLSDVAIQALQRFRAAYSTSPAS